MNQSEESEAEDLSTSNHETASTSRKDQMSPELSHNEVSSSKEDDISRSSSPIADTSYDTAEVAAPKYSWHSPAMSLAPDTPIINNSSVVPLLLPYHPLSHSVVYMNPFIPSSCQTTMIEKKKRNRTFIDPVSEVNIS